MSLAGICRMITDIQKCKNDNLFSDQVLVLLMLSNGRECGVVMKTVVLLIRILPYRCWKKRIVVDIWQLAEMRPMRMKYCVSVGKNRQCECIIGGITNDGNVDNASDYPVINWLNQLNKLVIEGYITKRRKN